MQNIENNEITNKGFVSVPNSENVDIFSSFLTKSADSQFNGAVSFHDITSFFPEVGVNNVLRQRCLHVLTDASYVEIPRTQGIVVSNGVAAVRANLSESVKIEIKEEYAKWLLPRSLFHKIEGYQDYLKNVFSDSLVALENKIFNTFWSADNRFVIGAGEHNWDQIRSLEYVNNTNFVDNLLKLKSWLPSRYLKNAIFVMSKKFLSYFYSFRDADGRYVFDGVNKIFGHDVEFVDELENKILFGDLKQSIVLAEKLYPKIEMHSGFDNPNQVGLSMPVSIGLGLINNDAIVGFSLTDEQVNELNNRVNMVQAVDING